MRFTIARAVVGDWRSTSHRAKVKPIRRRILRQRMQERRNARLDQLCPASESRRDSACASRAFRRVRSSTSCDEPSGCCRHSSSICVVGVFPFRDRRPPVTEDGLRCCCRCALVARDRKNLAHAARQRIGRRHLGAVVTDRRNPPEIVILVVVAVPAAVVLLQIERQDASPPSSSDRLFGDVNTALRG